MFIRHECVYMLRNLEPIRQRDTWSRNIYWRIYSSVSYCGDNCYIWWTRLNEFVYHGAPQDAVCMNCNKPLVSAGLDAYMRVPNKTAEGTHISYLVCPECGLA